MATVRAQFKQNMREVEDDKVRPSECSCVQLMAPCRQRRCTAHNIVHIS